MFKCPKCGERTVTYATKRTTGEFVYGRYRRCPTCGTKFATIERLMDADEEMYPTPKKAFLDGYKTALAKIGEVAEKMATIKRYVT